MSSQNPSSDFRNFSEQRLKAASWYVSHKILLKKILIGVMIAVSAGFLGYGLYGLINYYFIEGPAFKRSMRELTQTVDFEALKSRFQPQSLETGTVSIISSGKEKYDLAAKIVNPNPNWRVEFDYYFIVDGQPLDTKKGFILPSEEKFLINLSFDSKTKPRRAEIEISNANWQRIDSRQIPDYVQWRDQRFNFIFENVQFSPAIIHDSITVSRASFNVRNATAYGFWNVGFYIFLYRGSTLVGTTYVTIREFSSGQNRPVEVSWFEPISSVTQVKIFPEVDIFDQRTYMPVN